MKRCTINCLVLASCNYCFTLCREIEFDMLSFLWGNYWDDGNVAWGLFCFADPRMRNACEKSSILTFCRNRNTFKVPSMDTSHPALLILVFYFVLLLFFYSRSQLLITNYKSFLLLK